MFDGSTVRHYLLDFTKKKKLFKKFFQNFLLEKLIRENGELAFFELKKKFVFKHKF